MEYTSLSFIYNCNNKSGIVAILKTVDVFTEENIREAEELRYTNSVARYFLVFAKEEKGRRIKMIEAAKKLEPNVMSLFIEKKNPFDMCSTENLQYMADMTQQMCYMITLFPECMSNTNDHTDKIIMKLVDLDRDDILIDLIKTMKERREYPSDEIMNYCGKLKGGKSPGVVISGKSKGKTFTEKYSKIELLQRCSSVSSELISELFHFYEHKYNDNEYSVLANSLFIKSKRLGLTELSILLLEDPFVIDGEVGIVKL